jgi:hypothetical protein
LQIDVRVVHRLPDSEDGLGTKRLSRLASLLGEFTRNIAVFRDILMEYK